jgi:hypothetical protein
LIVFPCIEKSIRIYRHDIVLFLRFSVPSPLHWFHSNSSNHLVTCQTHCAWQGPSKHSCKWQKQQQRHRSASQESPTWPFVLKSYRYIHFDNVVVLLSTMKIFVTTNLLIWGFCILKVFYLNKIFFVFLDCLSILI